MTETTGTLIIAEAGVNHNGCMDRARALIDAAVDAGADIVKFQSFRADRLASKDAPKADYQVANAGAQESQYEMLKRLELSQQDHEDLIAYCNQSGIEFLSTPFDIDGLHMLVDDYHLKTIKLGSSELTNAPILLAAAKTGQQVILSTGMATIDEIKEALGVLAYGYLEIGDTPLRSDFMAAYNNPKAQAYLKEKVTILHCTTAYPTPYQDVNLNIIHSLRNELDIRVGYSDHTMGIEVSIAAVAIGACVIEKHFTLDRNLPGPDHLASLEPDELKAMICAIRHVEQAMGGYEKKPAQAEMPNMFMARKSIVAARSIAQGEQITSQNTDIKRPANGPSPMEYWEILGTKATKNYKPDEPI
ncbi:MAG: N-acetylneuraminate synthase [Cohaesibacter sp.]|nr:N-acetylneuraminate synthase [Cohaesibacter sp.]